MEFKSKELQHGVVVFSVGLRKEWAKVASYWVSLVAVKIGPLTFWHPARSWSFKKDGELIAEDIAGSRQTRPEQAFRAMKDMIQDKIHNSGYVLHGVNLETGIEPTLLPATMMAEINSFCSLLQQVTTAVQQASKLSPAPVMDWVEQKAQEARAKEEEHNAFQAAVKRRKQGAKW
jgi:hypothetical protein